MSNDFEAGFLVGVIVAVIVVAVFIVPAYETFYPPRFIDESPQWDTLIQRYNRIGSQLIDLDEPRVDHICSIYCLYREIHISLWIKKNFISRSLVLVRKLVIRARFYFKFHVITRDKLYNK